MKVLGITHPISWNTAAVLLEDGKIVAASEEERMVRIKHAPRMIPFNSIEFVLKEANLKNDDIDIIAISWDGPHDVDEIDGSMKKENATYLSKEVQRDFWIQSIEKEKALMKFLDNKFSKSKKVFVNHHIAHAASSCFVSGLDKSLVITIDGRGEHESGLIGIYHNGEFEIIKKMELEESLGHLYGSFTWKAGFRGHTDEGKVMGLAPYGTPIDSLLDIVKVHDNYKIEINWNKIDSLATDQFVGEDPTKDQRKDFAATVQYLLEKSVLKIVEDLTSISGIHDLCLAGGCALNIDMNGTILASGLVNNLFIQPAAHDAGCALGAALYVHHQYSSNKFDKMKHAYLGPNLDESDVKEYLDSSGLKYTEMSDITGEVSQLIANNMIIGWIQGRAEFGPRALGARSLLANPTNEKMWKMVNRVKGREYWRPLAPSVIEEETEQFFDNFNTKSPFMLQRFRVKEEKIKEIPAVVHVDNSARPQTVERESNPLYWDLLRKFSDLKGVPVLINTSLNLRGEPMVNTIQDGIRTLYNSNIDYLCVGKFLIYRTK